jgi:fructose-bisphosphate aldolase class I
MSFSYGRALQAPVLKTWAGDDANQAAAQATLLKRAGLNSAARYGSYIPDLETSPPTEAASGVSH